MGTVKLGIVRLMSSFPSHLCVFFGKPGQGQDGWYWTEASTQKPKAAFGGPFETKEQAIENALQSVAARQSPDGESGERGAA